MAEVALHSARTEVEGVHAGFDSQEEAHQSNNHWRVALARCSGHYVAEVQEEDHIQSPGRVLHDCRYFLRMVADL